MQTGFERLDLRPGEKSTIFLDVDGTIVVDSSSEISSGVFDAIQNLARENVVYLLSNHANTIQNRTLASGVGLRYLETPHKKPCRRILESLPGDHRTRPLIVIGDKTMVDGLFARRIGARFVKVGRLVSPRDRLITKLTYALDDIVSFAWSPFQKESWREH
jgi:predicted HAD superfamily phosphohydrolase YqeG